MTLRRTTSPYASKAAGRRPCPRRAFTIIELLISVTIIIILLSILIVAVNAAQRTAQKAKTESLMTAIKQGMVRFKEDMGYIPPVLDINRDLPMTGGQAALPNPADSSYIDDVQDWYSVTSLPDYLLGYSHHQHDGYGYNPAQSSLLDWDAETPPLGIRHPQSDGVWGASRISGALGDRMKDTGGFYGSETSTHPFDTGKVYGPYIDLQDERVLGSVTAGSGNTLTIHLPGDSGYNPDDPKVILDYWGQPLRYYRRTYPAGGLKTSYRTGTAAFVPTLADVFLLRPFTLKVGQDVEARFADDGGDTAASVELKSASFAIFSSGPDLGVDQRGRRDDSPTSDYDGDGILGENEDNIVGVGQ